MAELDAITNKKDAAAIKDFIDKSSVTARRPYDKFSQSGSSQLSFIASVNTSDFLKDPTGSRRFLVLPVINLDTNHKVDMQQVYAQCKYLLDNGESYWLTKAEEDVQVEINANFSSDSLAEVIIENLEAGTLGDWMSISEMREKAASSLNMPGIRSISISELRNKIERLGYSTKQEGKGAKKFNVRFKVIAFNGIQNQN